MQPPPLQYRAARLLDYLVIGGSLGAAERQRMAILGTNPDPEMLALGLYDGSPRHWTAFAGSRIWAVAGWVLTGEAIYRSYFLHHPELFTRYGSEITKITAEVIDTMLAHADRLRLEIWCLTDTPTKVTDWYEKLGFRREAELAGCGCHGESVWIYSRVKVAV